MGKKVRIAFFILSALVMGMLSGCGLQSGHGSSTDWSEPEREIVLTGVLVPRAEFQAVNLTQEKLGFVWWGDRIVYRTGSTDGQLGQWKAFWVAEALDGSGEAGILAAENDSRGISDFFTDVHGNQYLFGWESGKKRFYLQKKERDGQEIYTVFPEIASENPRLFYGFADGAGNIALLDRRTGNVSLLDFDGKVSGSGRTEMSSPYFMDCGEDGIYLAETDNILNQARLQKISFAEGEVGPVKTIELPKQESMINGQSRYAALLGGGEMGLLLSTKDVLYHLDPESGKTEEVMRWDSDGVMIDGTTVTHFRPGKISDGNREFEVLTGCDASSFLMGSAEPELAKIGWVDQGYIPQRRKITLGSANRTAALESAIHRFNRTHPEYYLEVQVFDGLRILEETVKSGGEIPDLLDARSGVLEALEEKGLLEDLGPWLERSRVIGKEDLLKAAYDTGVYDGKLTSVVTRFSVSGLLATGDSFTRKGFTFADYAEYAQSRPDAALTTLANPGILTIHILTGTMDSFVDWKKGKCYFGDKEFISYLKRMKELWPQACKASGALSGRETAAVAGGTVVYGAYYCKNPADYYDNVTKKKGYLEMVGFPSAKGEAFFALYPWEQYAVYAASDCREGAWAFLEFLLSEEEQRRYNDGKTATNVFPVNQKVMEAYLDQSLGGVSAEEEVRKEVKEDVRYLLDHLYPSQIGGRNQVIRGIIMEELGAFLSGDKTAEETAKLIQNRANLYISEHR